ncbi:glycoside hydrolase family 88 protein [Cellulomonas hominis]|uniref:glycoside hydrolase family 88 protein n=1 Tax=Cellulomonas hominis TaxID=156981 RepID=UPI0014444E45|nr:glycoside hydrolase family 88 protein [Cellulomonas hominis]NKY08891.1 glucuronyl hydrolase [Cellulomonas hominis]
MTTTDALAPATRDALAAALRTLDANIAEFGDRYPDDTTSGGRYPLRPATADLPEGANRGWTTSFWPGQLWLAHELTGEQRYLDAASAHVASFADRIAREVDIDTHDLGFLYTLSCVTAWRRTGDTGARAAALGAADALMRRFLEPAGIVQAWGDLSDPAQRGRTIIDSLMNMPLLRWASAESGDPRFAAAADRHTAQLRDHILRPDDTTFHTFFWDAETGAPLRGGTEQGLSDGSCWARGQAWGIFGFALAYRETGDASFLDAARRCAEYFLAHLPADHVAFWDLVLTDGTLAERDSSSAAIAACGLDELARLLPGDAEGAAAAGRYRRAGEAVLDSLAASFTSGPDAGPGAPHLLHGVYDMPKSVGVDEGNLWGDYYYLEALTRRLLPGWDSVWWVRPAAAAAAGA